MTTTDFTSCLHLQLLHQWPRGAHFSSLLGRCSILLALGLCWGPRAAAQQVAPAAQPERVTISGVALDDSLNVPIPDLWLYLNETKYGAVTDAQGKFSFSFPTNWKPVRGGELRLFVVPIGYTFKPLRRRLDWRTYDPMNSLVLRLASAPERGRPNYHGFRLMAPPLPPPVYPPSVRTARPH